MNSKRGKRGEGPRERAKVVRMRWHGRALGTSTFGRVVERVEASFSEGSVQALSVHKMSVIRRLDPDV